MSKKGSHAVMAALERRNVFRIVSAIPTCNPNMASSTRRRATLPYLEGAHNGPREARPLGRASREPHLLREVIRVSSERHQRCVVRAPSERHHRASSERYQSVIRASSERHQTARSYRGRVETPATRKPATRWRPERRGRARQRARVPQISVERRCGRSERPRARRVERLARCPARASVYKIDVEHQLMRR